MLAVSSFLDKKGFLHALLLCYWGRQVSDSNEEPYSTIFASLKHPIRRRILRMLSKKPMSFSELLEGLGVSSSFLTYHLDNLGELVGKIDGGKYRLSSFGEAAMATMTKVEDIPTSISTKPKRMIGRNVAIALGLVCIILAVGLIGVFAYYAPTINDKNNMISSLDAQISKLNSNVTDLQKQITSDNTAINSLTSDLTYLQDELKTVLDNSSSLEDMIMSDPSAWANSTVLVKGVIHAIPYPIAPYDIPPYDYELSLNGYNIGVSWQSSVYSEENVTVLGVVTGGHSKWFFPFNDTSLSGPLVYFIKAESIELLL